MVIKKIDRKCIVCGKRKRIRVYEDGHYRNAHYFGTLKVPVGKGEYKKTGSLKIGRESHDVVAWTGKKKEVEYWECNDCFDEGVFEYWLEEKIEKLFGKRCPDEEKECACCQAWSVYDEIIKDNR